MFYYTLERATLQHNERILISNGLILSSHTERIKYMFQLSTFRDTNEALVESLHLYNENPADAYFMVE